MQIDLFDVRNEKLFDIFFSFEIEECKIQVGSLGNCEICNKSAPQMFFQVRYKHNSFINPITGKQCVSYENSAYGHYDCLLSVRQKTVL